MIGVGVRVVTHSVLLPRSRTGRRRRGVTPPSSLTGRLVHSVGPSLSGLNGVKQRQPVERASAAGGGSILRRGIPAWPGRTRPGWLARFENDRDLTAIKAVLIGAAVLIAMALEVPW